MYALEYKQLYIPREALTKNRTCQSYRWKQYAETPGGVARRPAGR